MDFSTKIDKTIGNVIQILNQDGVLFSYSKDIRSYTSFNYAYPIPYFTLYPNSKIYFIEFHGYAVMALEEYILLGKDAVVVVDLLYNNSVQASYYDDVEEGITEVKLLSEIMKIIGRKLDQTVKSYRIFSESLERIQLQLEMEQE